MDFWNFLMDLHILWCSEYDLGIFRHTCIFVSVRLLTLFRCILIKALIYVIHETFNFVPVWNKLVRIWFGAYHETFFFLSCALSDDLQLKAVHCKHREDKSYISLSVGCSCIWHNKTHNEKLWRLNFNINYWKFHCYTMFFLRIWVAVG